MHTCIAKSSLKSFDLGLFCRTRLINSLHQHVKKRKTCISCYRTCSVRKVNGNDSVSDHKTNYIDAGFIMTRSWRLKWKIVSVKINILSRRRKFWWYWRFYIQHLLRLIFFACLRFRTTFVVENTLLFYQNVGAGETRNWCKVYLHDRICRIRFLLWRMWSNEHASKRQISNLDVSELVKIWHQHSFSYTRMTIDRHLQ